MNREVAWDTAGLSGMKQPLEVLIFILLAMAMRAIWIQLLKYILRPLEQDTTFTDPGPSNAIIYQIPKKEKQAL